MMWMMCDDSVLILGCVKAPTQEKGQSLPAHTEADCLQKEIFLGEVFSLSEYLAHRFKSISLTILSQYT